MDAELEQSLGPPFSGCDRVAVIFESDAIARGWPRLFEEQRAPLERELGAPFRITDAENDEPRWLVRCSALVTGPTLRLDRRQRLLISEGRDLDEVEETFSYLRSLHRYQGGDWIIADCATTEQAADRIATEVGSSFAGFALRGLSWETICDRYRPLVINAPDPVSVMQEWTAQLQDAHTWVRPHPALGELPYRLWTNGDVAYFRDVPPASEGFAHGLRRGFRLIGENLAEWWRRTASTPHAKPFLVGRRLLAAAIGTARTLTAASQDGHVVSWTEVVPAVSWETLVTWSRLASGNGYLRISAFIETADFDDLLQAAFDSMRDCNALIVDLRGNPGRAISLGNQWSGTALRQPAFGSLVKEEPTPEKPKSKVAKGPSFKDYRRRIQLPSGLRPVKFSAAQKNVLKELRQQFDNPPLGNTPDLAGLEKLNCPKFIVRKAKKAKADGQTSHPYRQGGPQLERRVKSLLAKDSKLAKMLWTAKDPDAEYLAGMILKGRIATRPDNSGSEVTDKGYLRAADLDGSVSARYALLIIYLFAVAYTLGAPQGHTPEVLAELEQLAKGGSGGAALDLSEHYGSCKYGMCSGRKDFVQLDQRVEVRDWACRSAKAGFTPGVAACGAHLLEGVGGPKDEARAIKLLGEAALAGDGQAAKRLSIHFERMKDLKGYNE